jgi:hypothetical protein
MTAPQAFRLQARCETARLFRLAVQKTGAGRGAVSRTIRGACEPFLDTARRAVSWNQPTRIVEEPRRALTARFISTMTAARLFVAPVPPRAAMRRPLRCSPSASQIRFAADLVCSFRTSESNRATGNAFYLSPSPTARNHWESGPSGGRTNRHDSEQTPARIDWQRDPQRNRLRRHEMPGNVRWAGCRAPEVEDGDKCKPLDLARLLSEVLIGASRGVRRAGDSVHGDAPAASARTHRRAGMPQGDPEGPAHSRAVDGRPWTRCSGGRRG